MTIPAIPVSQLVNVTPATQPAGGSNLTMLGMFLTQAAVASSGGAPRVPVGSVLGFPSQSAVGTFFGTGSTEYSLSGNYFVGYDNSSKKPATMLFANFNYNQAAPAYVRGQTFGAATFVASPVSSGTLNITIDGQAFAATGINISTGAGGTSYSAVAGLVQTALNTAIAAVSIGNATTSTIAGTVFTAAGTLTGTFAPGQVLSGGTVSVSTIILAQLTGPSGGLGTYTVNNSQTVSSASITGKVQPVTVSFDSVSASYFITSGNTTGNSTITVTSGTVGAFLQTNTAQNPTLSQGSVQTNGAGTIAAAMNAIVATNNNWGGFMTVFEPSTVDKLNFAAWVSPQPYWWAMWDSLTALLANAAGDTTSAGAQINLAGYSGVQCLTYDPVFSGATVAQLQATAAASLGFGASVNYGETDGREDWAYATQSGLAPTVTNGTIAANIYNNKNLAGVAPVYSFYGAYANAGNAFASFQFGSVSGPFNWLDSYTNQIVLNNNLATTLFQYRKSKGFIPFNSGGYSGIDEALGGGGAQNTVGSQPSATTPEPGPIQAMLNFGGINVGVVLSGLQVAAVNAAAGLPIDGYLYTQGFYLQVKDPGPTVRNARGSPIINLWYMDGESANVFQITSTNVQ